MLIGAGIGIYDVQYWVGPSTGSGQAGSGVDASTCLLEVREDEGAWQTFSTQCGGDDTHDGQPGHTYTFRFTASDNVSNAASTEVEALVPYVKKYYYANGQRVAMRKEGVVYYLHGDHLGSTSLTTCGSQDGCDGTLYQGVVARQLYHPYGSPRWSQGTLPTDYTFTGQRLEAGIGLMHYGARFYSPRLGRFVSADVLVPHPGDPQSWNRYSYVLNNPLKYVDPTGHQKEVALALWGFAVLPLPFDEILLIPAGLVCMLLDPTVQEAVQGLILYGQYMPAYADTWVRAGEAAQNAGNYLDKGGDTGNAGGADPNDPWRWGTDYRANYEEYYSVTRDPDYQVHHALPQEWRDVLAKAKINVDDPRWLREVQSNPSLGNLHQEYYTNRWGEFARNLQGRAPTPQEIVRFAQGLEQEYLERFGTAFYRQGTGMPGGIDWQVLWNELNVGLQQGGMP